ncbi:twin-arginine translocation pathway signal protein [Salaquimonas pukyongi]|uniref:twin-arginine translocation pathway signal protein n=1 Tax=Salaquimonas pukyongi TaxID=2712698 RepID=UPI00096B9929|nr:twin-arginine translocation pathway signal protein [Salaquimonas pukyongi]
MSKSSEAISEKGKGRRDFLKMAALSAPAAVAAAGTMGAEARAAVPDPASETIQDTEHTRAYYDSARF